MFCWIFGDVVSEPDSLLSGISFGGSAGTLEGRNLWQREEAPTKLLPAFADLILMIEAVFEQKLRLPFPVFSSVVQFT
jgi:hypothetical protein